MKKPRNLHIDGKIIKWRLKLENFGFSHISIWDGQHYKIELFEFVNFVNSCNPMDTICEDYSCNNKICYPQVTPANVKKYYLEKLKYDK